MNPCLCINTTNFDSYRFQSRCQYYKIISFQSFKFILNLRFQPYGKRTHMEHFYPNIDYTTLDIVLKENHHPTKNLPKIEYFTSFSNMQLKLEEKLNYLAITIKGLRLLPCKPQTRISFILIQPILLLSLCQIEFSLSESLQSHLPNNDLFILIIFSMLNPHFFL